MSGPTELNFTPPTSAVRNTVGKEKEQTLTKPDRLASDATLREYCDKHYHQLLPIIAEKVHNEKVQQEKLKEAGDRGRSVFAHSESCYQDSRSRRTEPLSESKDSRGGHWKSKSKKQKSSIEEEDLFQPWTCEDADPFTPRIRYSELPKKSQMPNNVKTYDGSDDPEDHLKIFQAAAKVEHWAMPTWCHMFNYTLTGSTRVWFDDLPPESIDSFDDLKKAFLANYLQQKNCIKDPIEIHHIKQRERESTEYFMWKKEILALNKGKFKAPPPMTTHVEKRNNNKFCEFMGTNVADPLKQRRGMG
ncbi:reverse transcriptase domain-containing protein [Tanacetum coccineum]